MSDAISTVEYRIVPGFPNYRVGDDGSIWSCRRRWRNGEKWKKMRHYVNNRGYCIIGLRKDGKCTDFRVHQLVTLAFIGHCPRGQEVRHRNGNRQDNRQDNRLSNLSYGTRTENMEDARRHGTLQVGEKHAQAKLTDQQAHEILRLLKTGIQGKIVAERFGVSRATVSEIKNGRHWKHIYKGGFRVED